MSLLGKSLSDYLSFVRTGLLAILAMGVLRFIVEVSGVPYDRATDLVSMTIVTALAALIYGQRAKASGFSGYRHLLPIAFLLSATMYGFIILAILVEGFAGIHGWFHAPGAGNAPAGMGIGDHIVGQLIVMCFSVVMSLGVASLGYLLSRPLGYLRNAFLLLAACFTLLVVYGIQVTEGLGGTNYFHAPGQGFQPAELSQAQHVLGHFRVSIVVTVFLSILAMAGFAVGKRKAPAPAAA